MEKYTEFRSKYPVFNYNSFDIEKSETETRITYHFEIEGLSEFSPVWTFPGECNDELLDVMAFNLGMVELVSYWKITCSPNVSVKCGTLSNEQIEWWKKLYFHGLGEFFYVNEIEPDITGFMNIESSGEKYTIGNGIKTSDDALVPVGGGKDSSVTIELLNKYPHKKTAYIINSRGATEETVRVSGLDAYRVKRTLDKNMLELNKKGFLNGHTPFSALVAFSSLISAKICGCGYVVLSNESSANESTVSGSTVNHQYSKSFEFESDFNEYESKFIKSGVKYFSLLRPISEYQIAMLFSRFEKYHDVFRSCNKGSKTDIWCAHCPKCLFVFLIMSPFIAHERLSEIFGDDMTVNPEMLEDFKKLTGLLPEKPFECVGSRDEINFAICETIKSFKGRELPYLFEFYKNSDLFAEYSGMENPFLTYYNDNNLLEDKFGSILKNALLGE